MYADNLHRINNNTRRSNINGDTTVTKQNKKVKMHISTLLLASKIIKQIKNANSGEEKTIDNVDVFRSKTRGDWMKLHVVYYYGKTHICVSNDL